MILFNVVSTVNITTVQTPQPRVFESMLFPGRLQSCRHSGRFVLQCYAGSGAHTGRVKAVQIKSRKLELESLTTLEPG